MVIPWLSLCCILLGMLLGFGSMFGCDIWVERHILPIFFISGITLFLVLYLRTNYAVIFTLSAIAGMGIFALTRMERLRQDFLAVIYYINNRSVAYNNKMIAPFEGVRGNIDNNLFLLMVGALFSVFITFFVFRLRNCWYGLLPVYAVLFIGMAVGKTPDKVSVLLLVIGITFAMSWVSRQERGGRRSFSFRGVRRQRPVWAYGILCIIMLAGMAAAWQYGRQTEEYVLKDAKKYLKRQHAIERQIKQSVEELVQYIRAGTGLDSNGDLSNSEPRYMDRAVIKITSSVKPKNALYLRGFVGGEYENGKWEECNTESFQKIIKGREKEEAILNVGFEFCENGIHFGRPKGLNQIRMEHIGVGKNSKFAYLPYFSDYKSVSDDSSEKCIILEGENGVRKKADKFYVKYYDVDKGDKGDLGDFGYRMEDLQLKDISAKKEEWEWYGNGWELPDRELERYFAYVKKTYGRLPKTGLNRLKKKADSLLTHRGDVDLLEGVRQVLAQQAVYDKKLEPVPSGKDYVEYFLFDQKKGFCEHFATAGALLLRACHVPARYAAGYKVAPDQFKQNKDGSYTAEVLDSDAHAWAEVFNMDYGWHPVEMTPGEGTASRRRDNAEQPEKTVSPVVREHERQTEHPKETETPAPTPEKNEGKDNKGQGRQASEGRGIVLSIALAAALLVLALAAYVLFQRYIQNNYRKKLQKKEGDRNAAILLRMELFLYWLKKCGKRGLLRKKEADWFAFFAEEYNEIGEEAWRQLKEILQEAEFSNQNVSQEKYDFFFESIVKAEQLIFCKQGKIRRGYLRALGI